MPLPWSSIIFSIIRHWRYSHHLSVRGSRWTGTLFFETRNLCFLQLLNFAIMSYGHGTGLVFLPFIFIFEQCVGDPGISHITVKEFHPKCIVNKGYLVNDEKILSTKFVNAPYVQFSKKRNNNGLTLYGFPSGATLCDSLQMQVQ